MILPGIIASSGGGVIVTANKATLTSDSTHHYLTFTSNNNADIDSSMAVDGGPLAIDYLLVGGGGGASIAFIASNTLYWDFAYHSAYFAYAYQCPNIPGTQMFSPSYYDPWAGAVAGYCFYDYYADSSKGVNTFSAAGAGAGGVLTGNMTINPGTYNLLTGKGGFSSTPTAGSNTTGFGLTAVGGGAGLGWGANASSSASRNGGSGGAIGTGTSGQGSNGASGSFTGVTGSNSMAKFGNFPCSQLISNGSFSNWNTGFNCIESSGTGGGPTAAGVGWGTTRVAFTDAALGSWSPNQAPAALKDGITALGIKVGIAGASPDIVTEEQPTAPGSGGGASQSATQNGTAGVIRVRFLKTAVAEVKVTA